LKDLYTIYKEFYIFDLMQHPVLSALVFLILLDIALGFSRAWATNSWDSKKSRMGLISHFALVIVLILVYPQLNHFGFGLLTDSFLLAFCLSYLSSIVANWKGLGGWIPPMLEKKLNYEIEKHNDVEPDMKGE